MQSNITDLVTLIFFCILINFHFVLNYNFLHTDPYEHVGKIHKKEKKTNHLYIAHTPTHTRLHTDKKKEKKETHPSTFLCIYMKKLINEVSGESIVCNQIYMILYLLYFVLLVSNLMFDLTIIVSIKKTVRVGHLH